MGKFEQHYCATCGEPLDENDEHLNPESDEDHSTGRGVPFAAELRRRQRMGEDATPPRERQRKRSRS